MRILKSPFIWSWSSFGWDTSS